MTKRALLYTEMIVADAILHGERDRLLGYSDAEHPVALQIGGSDPAKLAAAAEIASTYEYDEINLNVGCPSDRVQSGTFGACLMWEPELVGRCVSAMKDRVEIPVTVKCRIGVDEQEPGPALDNLAEQVWSAGADALWVHARKAWLQGLSPKENRDIPPLDYDRVYDLKSENQSRFIGINGGVEDLNQALQHLNQVDGVMLGRAAYHSPFILRDVDAQIFGDDVEAVTYTQIMESMMEYAEQHLMADGRLNHVTRHMVGLFQGVPGARKFRQILSTGAVKPGAGPEIIEQAFAVVDMLRNGIAA